MMGHGDASDNKIAVWRYGSIVDTSRDPVELLFKQWVNDRGYPLYIAVEG